MRISTSELQRSEYDSGLSHTSSHILQDDEHGIGMPQHLTVDIDSESVAFDDIETWAYLCTPSPRPVESRNFDMVPAVARILSVKHIHMNIAWLKCYEQNHQPTAPHHLPMVGQIEDLRENISQVCTVLARNNGLQTIKVTYPQGLHETSLRRLLGPLGWIKVELAASLETDSALGIVRDLHRGQEIGGCDRALRELKRTIEDRRSSRTASAYLDIEWISIREWALHADLPTHNNSILYQTWFAMAIGDPGYFRQCRQAIKSILLGAPRVTATSQIMRILLPERRRTWPLTQAWTVV
ncbi:MAG: hypothetical protein L6R40_000294 [Gallowayella cf. fulva]|nr:MAG: hypothetical protein L6R40_000294 [Xanthomendoza cf. fulva]